MDASEGGVAVVTGAASGIGRATAERWLAAGGCVVGGDRTPDGLVWLDGDRSAAVTGDVSTEETNDALVASAIGRFGRLDALVLNAGIAGNPPIDGDGALARFDELLAVNLRGVVLGVRAALPALRSAGGGSVVVTASVSGLGGDPGMWAYNASKGGVVNLVRALAVDLAAAGIRVNAVCPGPVRTGLTAPVEQHAPAAFAALRRHVPLQRWGEPAEVAAVICFLASSAASFVTGAVVPVDGGVSANTGQFLPPEA